MRLERLHTPPTLTHPCTRTPTHTTPLDKGGSSKSSHLTLYWSHRAVGMEKRAAHSPRLQNCQDRNTTRGRHLEKPAMIGRACPSTNLNTNPTPEGFWGFFEKLENKIQDKWGKTSQSLWTTIFSVRHSGPKRQNITNGALWGHKWHPSPVPSTKDQRAEEIFPFKASKNQLAFKKGGKMGGVNHSFSKKRSLFHPVSTIP